MSFPTHFRPKSRLRIGAAKVETFLLAAKIIFSINQFYLLLQQKSAIILNIKISSL
jgi:hypothetical protein